MPTYQYHCTKCDREFEKFQAMTDTPLSTCPKELCALKKWGKGKVKKLISGGAGLIFKGTGFYITDYRSDKYKEAAKKDAPGDASKAGDAKTPTPAKAEGKPAKTESKGAPKSSA
jgi:putative FmdB family regulatory protein